MINNVTLHRLPDGLPVPVFNLSLSLDAASWTWGFDAQLPAAAESLVAPGSNGGPVELVASVNGTAFRVLAESIIRERVFGDASIRISGRGRNAVLAAPYAPVMNFQRWVEKPGYNRVFVSGQDVGVLGQVTRAGTAGDVLAPMVVDALFAAEAKLGAQGVPTSLSSGGNG